MWTGFECVVKDTEWSALALDIEWIARRQRCPRCNNEFSAGPIAEAFTDVAPFADSTFSPFTACPQCGEVATITIAGEELQIAYVEVDDSPGDSAASTMPVNSRGDA